MENIISTLITTLHPTVLPLVVVILGLFWIYRKTSDIKKDREETKLQRDADSQNLHDMVQKNTWEINNLKMETSHRDTIIDDLRQQVNELNVNLAVVSQKLDALVEAIRELKDK